MEIWIVDRGGRGMEEKKHIHVYSASDERKNA